MVEVVDFNNKVKKDEPTELLLTVEYDNGDAVTFDGIVAIGYSESSENILLGYRALDDNPNMDIPRVFINMDKVKWMTIYEDRTE